MENDRGTEISHLYMTAMMVKLQLTLSVRSSLSPVITFSIHHLHPHFTSSLHPASLLCYLPHKLHSLSAPNELLTAHYSLICQRWKPVIFVQ